MNEDVKFGLRDYFRTMRSFSHEGDWGCFFNAQREMFGYLRALYYAGVIDAVLYHKLFDIVNHMIRTFGD